MSPPQFYLRLALYLTPLLPAARGGQARAAPTELECPLPGGARSATPTVCGQFTACVWTDGDGCRLTDRVGYRVQRAVSRRQLLLTKSSDVTLFGEDVQRLMVTVTEHDRQRVRIVFRDADRQRFEVPLRLNLPPPRHRRQRAEYRVHLPSAPAELGPDVSGPPFSLSVQHGRQTALRLLPQLSYSDQFIETTLLLAGEHLYGMGENNHDRFRHDLDAAATWPIFARGRPPGDGHEALYGVHPFLLAIENASGKSLGVLFLNSNAMEYKVFRLNGSAAVTFRTTGGVLDLCLFFGRSPLEVLRQYHLTIGLPELPSYWALGFQLSRFGYRSVDEVRRTVARTRAAGIPLDVQYVDVDYMDGRRDFTVGKDKFGDLSRLVADLRKLDIHASLLYDPSLATDFGRYPPLKRGVARDVFVRWWNDSLIPEDQCAGCRHYVAGYLWTRNKTLLVDFFQEAATHWWTDEMRRFSKSAGGPEGFWIDMNEPTNFGTNLEKPFNWPSSLPAWSLKCPVNRLDDPPYPTAHVRDTSNKSGRLSDRTICMTEQTHQRCIPRASSIASAQTL
ncbi:Sucrase-isomaltase, intestinal [Amphibalanus amphitrite]|uniref:Sucrase-isomaltase, intestinal n=1 Tax=Amphibalanus amphitrite TaxID=1232801 RepID=A0A6A4W577_AMPAM|nr:Sucrase-isomaltase, intestinal [Amphibalanus amphitrite]